MYVYHTSIFYRLWIWESGSLIPAEFWALPLNKAGIGGGGALRFPWFTKKKPTFRQLEFVESSSLQRKERRDRSIWTWISGQIGLEFRESTKVRGNSVPTKWSTSPSFSFVCLVGDIFMDSTVGIC